MLWEILDDLLFLFILLGIVMVWEDFLYRASKAGKKSRK